MHFLHRIIFYGIFIVGAFGCSNQSQTAEIPHTVESAHAQNLETGKLATGWYYISSSETEFQRKLEKSDTLSYFLNPKPIAVQSDFGTIEIYKSDAGGEDYVGLTIPLEGDAVKRWFEATDSYVGKNLGLIVNDRLVHAPAVFSSVGNGMSALNRIDYSEEELLEIKNELDK